MMHVSGSAPSRAALLATVAVCALAGPAFADDVGKIFSLGEVTASAPTPDGASVGGATITQEQIRQFNRDTLDTAIDMVPGASFALVGGRNETNVYLRGFDRWRVPLLIDGIPVYLPDDNRLDFSRFTTADISEIQVTKGFTSVIDGPGALGGSINLVSRQVTQPFEGDARLGFKFDQTGGFSGLVSDVFAGSKIDKWYIQGAITENYTDHWRESDDYIPGSLQQAGNRIGSQAEDYKLNFKIGYTPSAGDEYSLNAIDQKGDKDTPVPDTVVNSSAAKYWTWPEWDKQSVYWLSKTAIDDRGSYIKTSAYYDRFYNVLDIWDNINVNTMNSSSAEISTYDDRGAGGHVEISEMLFGGRDNVKAAFHVRWDQHNSTQGENINPGQWIYLPKLQDDEAVYSAALENTFHPTAAWDVTAGASYDYRQMIKAEDFDTMAAVHGLIPAPFGNVFGYPLSDNRAVNPEFAVLYHYDQTGAVHASVSERTRFPTLFEMFSSKFGTSVGNPYLQPEKSINYETGVAETLGHTRLGANLFYSHMMNAIESVPVFYPSLNKSYNQSQNIGTEVHEGFELEATSKVLDTLKAGANYTYLMRQVVDHVDGVMATDTPRHKGFVWLDWMPITDLTVQPSVQLDGKRWLQSATSSPTYYYRGADSAVANLKVAYQITKAIQVDAGVNNLFDQNYEVEDGYHGQGRNLFTDLRVKF